MCSGKSTVGQILSSYLNYLFIDIDKEIESRQNMSIEDIFNQKGESFFRAFEIEVLKDISKPHRIISTGGGLGANQEAMDFMKKNGFVAFLNIDFDSFYKRCKDLDNRPLLKKPLEELKKLYNSRVPIYSQAHYTFDAFKSPEAIAKEIIKHYEQYKQNKGLN